LGLTNVVTSDVPVPAEAPGVCHSTVEFAVNPVPFTVKVNPGPSIVADDGLSEVIVGAAAIVKFTGCDTSGKKLPITCATAVIDAVPGAPIRLAATVAVT
jgi:hypothetical protein